MPATVLYRTPMNTNSCGGFFCLKLGTGSIKHYFGCLGQLKSSHQGILDNKKPLRTLMGNQCAQRRICGILIGKPSYTYVLSMLVIIPCSQRTVIITRKAMLRIA